MELVHNLHETNLGVELFGPEKAGQGWKNNDACKHAYLGEKNAMHTILIIHHLASQ